MPNQSPGVERFLDFGLSNLYLLDPSFLFFAYEAATQKPVDYLQLEALVCFGSLKDFVPLRQRQRLSCYLLGCLPLCSSEE